jgi:hypothetical protein
LPPGRSSGSREARDEAAQRAGTDRQADLGELAGGLDGGPEHAVVGGGRRGRRLGLSALSAWLGSGPWSRPRLGAGLCSGARLGSGLWSPLRPSAWTGCGLRGRLGLSALGALHRGRGRPLGAAPMGAGLGQATEYALGSLVAHRTDMIAYARPRVLKQPTLRPITPLRVCRRLKNRDLPTRLASLEEIRRTLKRTPLFYVLENTYGVKTSAQHPRIRVAAGLGGGSVRVDFIKCSNYNHGHV